MRGWNPWDGWPILNFALLAKFRVGRAMEGTSLPGPSNSPTQAETRLEWGTHLVPSGFYFVFYSRVFVDPVCFPSLACII
jgi:hypothetical protein